MTEIPFIMLDDEKRHFPLYIQIYEAIRLSVLSGHFDSRMRLPSTRSLAQQLGVSRMTVVNAYEQLLAEGYIKGKTGAGTFVASVLPEQLLQTRDAAPHRSAAPPARPPHSLSKRGKWLERTCVTTSCTRDDKSFQAFQNGLPAVDKFPFDVWSRLATRRLRHPPRELLGYGDPAGYRPLRASIAQYLKASRAVRCEPEQVIIVSGAQQALDLVARLLLDADDAVWIEDPCYPGARDALHSAGAELVSVPVDGDGFDLSAALRRKKDARLVYVTPSHQYPLGVTMSLARRLALLEWANRAGAWIIEDDYNSEYRYAGRPLASLQGLDAEGRVLYVGTFSKTIFPALRLGCLVVPPDLVDVFAAARALTDRHSATLDQAILTDFIEDGHFARHVRRMRVLYEERQGILVAAAERELSGLLDAPPAAAGMHLVGWLPEGVSDKAASESAARQRVKATPLSAYSLDPLSRGGLVLGYTALNARQIKDGVRKLAKALDAM
ncbi:MAG TPA: PLP-dependent aminotransferase family protein [Pyrinomonadaceae bacterium]|nr:PLP-dependent aminotransferase family protein [Pyrinomonadaceae bacterium]